MRKYRVKGLIYLVLPALVTTIIILYMVFMYKKSFSWANIFNLSFDVSILLYYLYKFCYGLSTDGQNLYFYTAFKTYRIPFKEYEKADYASFMVKVITTTRSFYILISKNDRYIIKEILKDEISSGK